MSMLSPHGRVVLVSGANRGIGRAIAATLYGKGYCVSLGARDPSSLETMTGGWDKARLGCHRFDALNKATHRAWIEATVRQFRRIDGLVNNAGISVPLT